MLTRLYLHNYRCFVNFELRPGRTSLLVGYNGTGKTSILDALYGVVRLLRWNAEATEAFPTDTLNLFGDSNQQRIELDISGPVGLYRYALRLEHEQTQHTCRIRSEIVTLEGEPLYSFQDTRVQLYRDDGTSARDTFEFSPKRSFLAALEEKPYNQKLMWLKRFLGGMWTLQIQPAGVRSSSSLEEDALDVDGSNFVSWFRHLMQDRPDRTTAAIQELRAILTGFHQIRAQTYGRARLLVATFQIPGGKTYDLDFHQLSSGQKCLIILYVLLYAMEGEASLICLDEPDNFVSIREIQPLLDTLTGRLEDGGAQTLLISHSAEVIDFLGPERTILLERPDGGPVRVGQMEKPKALRLSELMARGWHSSEEGEHGAG